MLFLILEIGFLSINFSELGLPPATLMNLKMADMDLRGNHFGTFFKEKVGKGSIEVSSFYLYCYLFLRLSL